MLLKRSILTCAAPRQSTTCFSKIAQRTFAAATEEQPAETAHTPKQSRSNKMQAWQIHSFGGLDQLSLSDSVRIPSLTSPNDVLIKVSTTSVNPIDLAMIGGYGSSIFNCAREAEQKLCGSGGSTLEFPLTLGRDFVGEVVECGVKVQGLRIGDEVWGVVPPFKRGTHAQYVVASGCHTTRTPKGANPVEAGGIPYAGLTALSSLWAPLAEMFWPKAKVLVLGGSGGVGSVAVQLLKAWGSQVVTTCKTDAVPIMESFGLDAVVDYTSPDFERDVKVLGPYDVILNAAGLPGTPHQDCLKEWKMARYVTISPPLLKNTDTYGVPVGAVRSWFDISSQNLESIRTKGAFVQWGFFVPSKSGLEQLAKLYSDGKIKPLVHQTFKFSDLPSAYKCQQDGHVRGKIVVEMDVE